MRCIVEKSDEFLWTRRGIFQNEVQSPPTADRFFLPVTWTWQSVNQIYAQGRMLLQSPHEGDAMK